MFNFLQQQEEQEKLNNNKRMRRTRTNNEEVPRRGVKEKEIILAIKIGNFEIAKEIISKNNANIEPTFNHNQIVFEILKLDKFSKTILDEKLNFLGYLNETYDNIFNDEIIETLHDSTYLQFTNCNKCIEFILKARS